MPWIAAGATVLSGVAGGLMGGSKAAERAAKDSAARAQFSQDQARRQAQAALSPYQDAGQGAARKLSQLLGTAEPEGYAPRPTLQDFEDKLRNEHFQKYGTDYGRNSNVAGQTVIAKQQYAQALKDWEAGKAKYQAANPGSEGSGDLLKNFTNDDFVKDPGYTFRQLEGEKGANRQLLARGAFDSGAALKELQRYTQDYASNEFNQAFTRDAANKQRTFGFLSGQAGQGLSAAGAQVGANQNAANNATNIQLGLGNTLANNAQNNADNQSNLFQNTIANLVYGYQRNKSSNPYQTPDFNPTMSGGSSSSNTFKAYI
jgi:hypothetical protein